MSVGVLKNVLVNGLQIGFGAVKLPEFLGIRFIDPLVKDIYILFEDKGPQDKPLAARKLVFKKKVGFGWLAEKHAASYPGLPLGLM